jgi:hypothetical protein
VIYRVLAALLLLAAIVAFRRKQERQERRGAGTQGAGGRGQVVPDDPEIDRATLEAAEREVKDMENDVRGRPLEDAVGDDWGPGTPKPPYV